MVVWEDGKMNKQAYRKFKVMTVLGVDDFASMREVVHRRYRRLLDEAKRPIGPGIVDPSAVGPGIVDPGAVGPDFSPDIEDASKDWALAPEARSSKSSPQMLGAPGLDSETWESTNACHAAHALKGHDFSRAENTLKSSRALAPEAKPSKEPKTLPSLILIDGGLGQLHAAADALESLGITSQPLASIAKREEIIYLHGNEDEPIVLDRRSPVLHLIQLIRDESHRFAVGYHRQRRAMRDRDSELLTIPGVGPQTRQRLLTHFGSLRDVQQATAESLAAVVPRKTAETIWRHFHQTQPAT
jgi:excinuclease UvrABC nuclease subunit